MEELQYRVRRNAQTIFYYIALVIVAILLLAALIIGAITVRFKQASKTGECVTSKDAYRLPKSVMPSNYNVHLHPNVKALTVSGSVEIDLDVLEATTCVYLHTEELDLKSVVLEQDTNSYKPAEMTHDKVTDVLKLSFDEKLTTDKKYKLKIEFSGKIRTDMRGFYIGSYEQNGRSIPVASTQMEATEARTSFPCFDEPEFKAVFQITFTVLGSDITGDSFRVLSNMPEKTRTAMSDGGFVVQFEPSVKMSSYLVAYVMGEFDPAYERALDIDFTIYTHPGEQNQGAIALEVSKQVTEFFTNFFGIKYALSKMDLIGIPDFRAGAMENWGLITFRDLYIYADSNTPENYKQAVREVVAHEIAHQWTGNLVTCGWWSHLWLNEGFATFFETFSLDKIFPEKKLWDEYLSMTIQPLLVTDSLPSTHAVVVADVSQQSDIDAMFDTITYNKGSAVLRMMYDYLGEEKFKSWVRAYFNKFQYKNAFTEDLFTVLKEQNPADPDIVANAMTWTHQAGYPVVTASQTDSGKIVLSQERYYAYPPEAAVSKPWWIPASILTSDGNVVTTTFTGAKSDELSISGPWFKVNAGQIGLYRVNYSPQLWTQLIQEIKNKNNRLTVSDKFGLIDDIFALARSGHTPIGTAFELAKAVSHDDNFVLWNALLTNLYTIERIIFTETYDTYYHRFIIQLLNDTVTKVGFDEQPGESGDIKQLRPLVLGAATAFGHEAAIAESLRRFDRYMNHNDTSAISKDMKAVVFNTAAREGKETAYFLLYNRFMETEDPHEKTIAMNALPSTTIPALLKKTLELVLTPAIKAQDGIYTIRYVSRNKYGVDLAWNWVRENYDAILEKYGKRTVDSRLITGATSMFASTLKYKEAEEFWKSKTTSPYVGVALETIKGNMQFLKSNAKNLNQWLQQNYQ